MIRMKVRILFLCTFFGSLHASQKPRSSSAPQQKSLTIINKHSNQQINSPQRQFLAVPTQHHTRRSSARSQDEIYYSGKASSSSSSSSSSSAGDRIISD